MQKARLKELFQFVELGFRVQLPNSPSLIRRPTANLLLDPIEHANTLDYRRGDRRLLIILSGKRMNVEELASSMRPARGLHDPRGTVFVALLVQCTIARVAVGLQDATEVFEVLLWVLAFTISRVGKPHRR